MDSYRANKTTDAGTDTGPSKVHLYTCQQLMPTKSDSQPPPADLKLSSRTPGLNRSVSFDVKIDSDSRNRLFRKSPKCCPRQLSPAPPGRWHWTTCCAGPRTP